VPVVPGYHGERQDAAFLKQKAYEVGYPLLIKAVAGGGGRGMRRVDRHADFDAALESAQREARASFGDDRVLIERYITAPRHIEIQVFGDQHGNVIHLGERDCSLQRRHQKVIEEAPAPGMTAELRATIGDAAVSAARAAGYFGAGTVEFIADGARELRSDGFWFMEMNTRLQVEHPVTEAVTGLDLVEWQFRVAAGEPLPLHQDAIRLGGHAVEARLYAEDPENGFLPSTGKILALDLPNEEGIRVDAGIAAGLIISPYYDPMIAKIIAYAPTRDVALERLAAAIDRTVVMGPRTNAAFLSALVRTAEFRAAKFDTGFIDANLAVLGAVVRPPDLAAAARGLADYLAREQARLAAERLRLEVPPSPWDATDGFQLAGPRLFDWPLAVDGKAVTARVAHAGAHLAVSVAGMPEADEAIVVVDGDTIYVLRFGRQTVVSLGSSDERDAGADSGGTIRAPMHGKVLSVLVEKGAAVHKGQRLAIIEAMKMEHALLAPANGVVREILAEGGSQIAEKAVVMVIEPAS